MERSSFCVRIFFVVLCKLINFVKSRLRNVFDLILIELGPTHEQAYVNQEILIKITLLNGLRKLT